MRHRYHVNVFWSEADGCWVADVPDLKSCSALGSTPRQALDEVELAIDGWLETATAHKLPIPDARYRPAIYAFAETT